MAYELLAKLGMNVEMVATDWGTVTQRRTSKELIEKGGWSILHTWAPSNVISTVVEHAFVRGLSGMGCFGWYGAEEPERLTMTWLQAKTEEKRSAITDMIHARAFETAPAIPLGQFQIHTAYRKNLNGLIEATSGQKLPDIFGEHSSVALLATGLSCDRLGASDCAYGIGRSVAPTMLSSAEPDLCWDLAWTFLG